MSAHTLDTRPLAHTPEMPVPARRSAPPPMAGELLDGALRVSRRLGCGGECEVYAAWDTSRSTPVALKMTRDDDLDDAARRMDSERAPLDAVSHPNLIRLFGAHLSEHRCYLVLEALNPDPLSERVRRERLCPEEAVRIIREVAAALTALHEAGWAHRDVKAENVLFGFDGRAVLTDLGLACDRALRGPTLSRSRGTPAYMAPEVISEQANDFATLCAADQYSLAVTAYFALTGSLPFLHDNVMATLFAHLTAPVPAVSSRRPELARFDAVLTRALAKNPAERFASVADFSAALGAALAA
jgi:serine/threonine protein kinase